MLFIRELRKMWRIWLIAFSGVFFLSAYYQYIRPNIQFCNADYHTLYFKHIAANFGATLEPEEAEQIRQEVEARQAEMDEWVAGYEPCQRYGIMTHEEAIADIFGENPRLTVEEWNNLCRYLESPETNNIDDRYGAPYELWYNYQEFRENMKDPEEYYARRVERGIGWSEYGGWEADSQEEFLRDGIRDLYTDENAYAIMKVRFLGYMSYWFGRLLGPALAMLLLLAGPVIVRERSRRMLPLQWSSRKGRKVTFIQFGAVMATAAAVGTGTSGLMFLILKKSNMLVFWNSKVTGNWCDYLDDLTIRPYVNTTFGHWFLMYAGLILIIMLACGAFIFIVSSILPNYFTMILTGFFLWFAMRDFAEKLAAAAFTHNNVMTRYLERPLGETYAAILSFVIVMIAAAVWMLLMQKKELKA